MGIFALLAGAYGLLNLLRLALAWREGRRQAGSTPVPAAESAVTVLQPILGGDPLLAACLAANLRHAPQARFHWLLDADDDAGIDAARQAQAQAGAGMALVLDIGPRPPLGLNPKSVKLARGLAAVTTPYLAVLDDDTVLPPATLGRAAAAALPGHLVTGLPSYTPQGGVWSRLVAGFVNGNVRLTYLPAAALGLSRTINGMFTLMRTDDLRQRGGFAAITDEVTDDYALARLFRNQNGFLRQLDLPVQVTTTVTGPRHYLALMRRWMVFARLYLAENASPALLALVLLPGLLALPMLLSALVAGGMAPLGALLFLSAKTLLLALLRPAPVALSDLGFEILAELLAPLHAVAAALRPGRIVWRNRQFHLDGKRIRDG